MQNPLILPMTWLTKHGRPISQCIQGKRMISVDIILLPSGLTSSSTIRLYSWNSFHLLKMLFWNTSSELLLLRLLIRVHTFPNKIYPTEKLLPIPVTQPTWPEQLEKSIACGCNKGCNWKCSCGKKPIPCFIWCCWIGSDESATIHDIWLRSLSTVIQMMIIMTNQKYMHVYACCNRL